MDTPHSDSDDRGDSEVNWVGGGGGKGFGRFYMHFVTDFGHISSWRKTSKKRCKEWDKYTSGTTSVFPFADAFEYDKDDDLFREYVILRDGLETV